MPSYLITGASRGIGYGFIQVLAANPVNTVIGLVRNKPATQKKLAADGLTNVHLVTGDLTDTASLKKAAAETQKILGDKGLDVLVNNAAFISTATAMTGLNDDEEDPTSLIAEFQKSFDANVYGILHTVYAFLPLIRRGTLKKVIAISSGMGDVDYINETIMEVAAPYAASKAALSTVFAKLNAAYQDQGILFMSICPGIVDTDATKMPDTEKEAARMQLALVKLQKYADEGNSSLALVAPTVSATNCLNLIESSSLEGGHGGSFRSHNGTRRWI